MFMKIFNDIGSEFEGMRLDKFLATVYSDLSRSKLQKMVKSGGVLVNQKPTKSSHILSLEDSVYVKDIVEGDFFELVSENLGLPILHEDDEFLIVDKPAGMVVHPSDSGHRSGTVVNALLDKIEEGVGEAMRPGIIHRLDKDTSGLLVVAKTQTAFSSLCAQFKDRTVKKTYLTLVHGSLLHKEGVIDAPMARSVGDRKKMGVAGEKGGKMAVSAYKVLREFTVDKKTSVSLLEVEIKTGRTHQIRVHMAAIDHPVIGDTSYGISSFNHSFSAKFGLKRQFLHAYTIELKHPVTGKVLTFKSDLPRDLNEVIKKLNDL